MLLRPKLRPRAALARARPQRTLSLGTVENHGNTEITETVILVKGRDFAKMPCFAVFFAEMPWFYAFFHKNTLFLISIS